MTTESMLKGAYGTAVGKSCKERLVWRNHGGSEEQ